MEERDEALGLSFAVTDFWEGVNPSMNPIVRAIAGRNAPDTADRRVASSDVVIYSVFGHRHQLARGTAVAFSAEPTCSPDRRSHWSIDWRHLPSSNHQRLPAWALGLVGLAGSEIPYDPSSTGSPDTRRFCNFIYSNPRCPTRNAFFELLNAREPVDSLGGVHRNASHPLLGARTSADWRATKRRVLGNYRFTIAFENEEHVGYSTEKLTDAWLSDSVPIYWGDRAVELDFPAGSYLSLHEAGTMGRLVEQVLEAHHDPTRYEELHSKNPFRTGHAQGLINRYRTELDEFGQRIRADAAIHRGRSRRSAPSRAVGAARFAQHRLRDWAMHQMS